MKRARYTSPLFICLALTFGVFFTLLKVDKAEALTLKPFTPPSNSGLMAWWTFDTADFIDSSHIRDKSGNGNTATLGLNVSPVANGKIGQALNFYGAANGQDNPLALTFGDNIFANTNAPFSISLWTYLNDFSPNIFPLAITLKTNGYWPFEIALSNYCPQYCGVLIGAAGDNWDRWSELMTNTNSSLLTNHWVHIVVTYNGFGYMYAGNFHVYINDVDQSLTGADGFYSDLSNTNSIGTGLYGYAGGVTVNNAFDGKIDDVRIFDHVLPSAEITKLFNTGTASGKYVINSAALASASALQSGLVEWLTLDSSGGLVDRSGHGNNGTWYSSVGTSVPGKIGQAINFNGSDNFIQVLSPSNIPTGSSPRTLTAWIKGFNSYYASDLKEIFGYGTNQNGHSGDLFYLTLGPWTNKLFLWGNSDNVAGNATINPDVWTQVGVAFDGSMEKLYVNGQVDATAYNSFNTTPDTDPGFIDTVGGAVSPYNSFDGSIDDVRIYNRALSDAEMLGLYNQTKKTVVNTSNSVPDLKNGLVTWWTFDGKDWASSLITLDKSGHGNDANLSSSGVTKASGKIGQGLKFDGANGYLWAPSLELYEMTISAWVKKTGGDGTYMRIAGEWNGSMIAGIGDGSDGNYRSWALGFTSDNTVTFVISPDGLNVAGVVSQTAPSDNKWYHIVGVIGQGKIWIYVNGVLEDSLAQGNIYQGYRAILIGAGEPYGGGFYDYFNGRIDDVRIYNRGLSAKEVMMLYKMGK